MFIWDDWNTRHIARHNVLPHEAEEVIDGDPFDLEVQIVHGEERVLSIGGCAAQAICPMEWVERWHSY